MAGKNEAFIKKLLSAFRAEAEEHITHITTGLIELEKDLTAQEKASIVETVFREAHSLKGAARAVNLSDVETICQCLESVFSGLKQGQIQLLPSMFDALHRAVDILGEINSCASKGLEADKDRIFNVSDMLEKIATGKFKEERPVPHHEPQPKDASRPSKPPSAMEIVEPVAARKQEPSDTVRISIERLDSLLRQSEEMLSLKLMADKQMEDVQNLVQLFGIWDKQWAKMYPIICEFRRLEEKIDKQGREKRKEDGRFVKILEFGDFAHDSMKALESRLAELRRTSEHNRYAAGLMVDNFIGDVKTILMLPFSTLFATFPKLIRNLSRDQDKEVELQVGGEEIEIDRRILEEMRIVFTHLIRNAVDHGIEKPEERKRAGKGRGTIKIMVSRIEGNKVEVLFSDDGKGIDVQALKTASVKRGIITSEAARDLSGRDALSLAFQSNVSTSPIITDISGRGLGLAIVLEKVEKLGGRAAFETDCQAGVSIRITLPLTFSALRGTLVTAAKRQFVIPSANVERVARINREQIQSVENQEALPLSDVTVPLVKLADILELSQREEETAVIPVLILRSQDKRIGFCVDEVLNEQEIFLKHLGPPLSRIRNVAAATILGSGKVVPVLNVYDLMKSAAKAAGRPAKPAAPAARAEAAKQSILVAEDSITSRMLLKNILETAGYQVITAVDGVDAFARIKTEKVDAVVSDVDMPRMNGFNLTEKIRGDKKLEELPVVLVTALDSREDRERGIDVGANAYIVKSSFDQSNLLETLRRLI